LVAAVCHRSRSQFSMIPRYVRCITQSIRVALGVDQPSFSARAAGRCGDRSNRGGGRWVAGACSQFLGGRSLNVCRSGAPRVKVRHRSTAANHPPPPLGRSPPVLSTTNTEVGVAAGPSRGRSRTCRWVSGIGTQDMTQVLAESW
jgi:hypothetical protein